MAEREAFVEFRGSLVLAGALAGLGFGVEALRAREVSWEHQFRARCWEVCISGFIVGLDCGFSGGGASAGVPRPVLPSLDGLDLSVGLGFARDGGLWEFGGVFCFAVGRTSVPLFGTPDIYTF